jgi:putative oxidoreductase
MAIETLIKTTRNRLLALTQRLSFLAPLLLRVTLGAVFIQTGWGHLSHLSDTIEAFRNDFHVPMPEINARIASCTEFFGGILILIGLGTRLAALPMAFTMVVAILTAKRSQIEGANLDGLTTLLGFEEWSYIVMFLTLAIIGPGAVSVDGLIARKLAKAPAATAPALRPESAPGNG